MKQVSINHNGNKYKVGNYMDIFQIGNDFDYFDLTFLNNKDVSLFSTFKGQKITLDWKADIFALLRINYKKMSV